MRKLLQMMLTERWSQWCLQPHCGTWSMLNGWVCQSMNLGQLGFHCGSFMCLSQIIILDLKLLVSFSELKGKSLLNIIVVATVIRHKFNTYIIIIELKKWSSHLLDNLSDCLICAPAKFQVSSTGFKPITSVMPVQYSYQLYEATQMWGGQFVGLMCSYERNDEWKKCLWIVVERWNDLRTVLSSSVRIVFKLVDMRSVATGFLRGLRYVNVSLTHSGVDTVRI